MLALVQFAALWLAHAEPAEERVALQWYGPAQCPESGFRAALARYAPGDAGPQLQVRAAVRAEGGRWKLDLDVAGGADAGTRQLDADRCEVVVDAAAFIVAQAMGGSPVPPPPAVAVEPAVSPPVEALAEVSPPAVEPSAGPSVTKPAAAEGAEDESDSQDLLAPEEPAAEGEALRLALRGAVRLRGGVAGFGVPGTGGVMGLVFGLLGRRWRAELSALGRLPVSVPIAGEVGASMGLWAVGARGCGVPGVRRLEFLLCGGAEVGQVTGRSSGLMPAGEAAVVWAAVVASPGLAWAPRPWIALVLEAELAVALVRHDWVVRGLGSFSDGPVDLRGFAGVELRFGGAKKP